MKGFLQSNGFMSSTKGFQSGKGFLHPAKGFQLGSLLNYIDEYKTVLSAMPIYPPAYDRFRQNRMMEKMVTNGYYAKAEILDLFSVDNESNALINWKNPSAKNPLKIGLPNFQKYAGFAGNDVVGALANINLKFNPFIDSTVITKDNMTIITGFGYDMMATADNFGGFSPYTARTTIRAAHSDNVAYFRFNSSVSGTIAANTDRIKYYSVSRNAADKFNIYLNKTKTQITSASTALPNVELYATGSNEDGTIKYTRNQVRFVFIFSYLTDVEIADVIDIMEEYFADYKTNLINWNENIIKADKATKQSITLTTYDGSGESAHPTVVDIGSDWNGYRYWMANTPYPSQNSAYENPSIWASADGINWVLPVGLTNPIVAQPVGGYNADSDLYYDIASNKLWMTYKEVIGTTRLIRICSSADGVTWSVPKTIITPIAGETELVSPSLIKIGAKYYIYCQVWNTSISNGTICKRLTCDTIDGTYGEREVISLQSQDDRNFGYWHHQISFINGVYWLAVADKRHCYIFKSSDGVTFTKSPYPVVFGMDRIIDLDGIYKPSMVTIGADVYLYYSHISQLSKFFISRVKLIVL